MSGFCVVHSDDLPWQSETHGELYEARRRDLGTAAGSQALGCQVVELPPGKTAWPLCYRLTNERGLFVLQGQGLLRRSDSQTSVRAGSFIALPTGVEHAHQLTNTGNEPLRVLVVSTRNTPEVIGYPDSDTLQVQGAGEDGGMLSVSSTPVGELWSREKTDLDGAEPEPEPDGPTRQETVDQMVEADLEALRRKLADQGASSGSSTARKAKRRPSDDDDDDAPPRDRSSDAASPSAPPKPQPATGPTDAPLDELEALKRKLDGG